MCFTRQLELGVAKIAQDDIFAFKILKKVGTELRSPSQFAVWKAGEVKTEPKFERIVQGSAVNVGLHCCKTLNNADLYNKNTYSYQKYKIYKVRIPKGSLYWENSTQFCADRMVLVSAQHYLKNGKLSKAKKNG